MNFLSPLSLALLSLAAPIIIFYVLKLRRREVDVSSTLLWSLLARDREANSPWQRLKRNLLLWLQLLLLLLFVLALARPFVPVLTVASGAVAVLLDASASMNATDVPPSRFAVAQAAARQIIEGLADGSALTLVLVTDHPQTLINASAKKDELLRAVDSARTSVAGADWPAAFALAAGAVGGANANRSTIVVISDGSLPRDLPPLPGEVRYVPIGVSSDNLALSALSLRPAAAGPQLFSSVTNHGQADRDVILSIDINGGLYNAQALNVPAGKSADVILSDLPKEPAIYRATLGLPPSSAQADNSVDSLAADDTAWAVYAPPTSGRVLLISPGNIFLEQVLAALPGLQPFRAPVDAPLPSDPFDLYVFDGGITHTLPVGPLLVINPPPTAGEIDPLNLRFLNAGGVFTDTADIKLADDPLLQFVDFSDVHILKARSVEVPDWARVLIASDGGPLLFAGETGGRRIAVLAFDLHDSDLPLQVAFPILIANLINWLSPAQVLSAPDGLRPGETITIRPPAGAAAVVVNTPGGETYSALPGEQGVIFAETRELGPYAVTVSAGAPARIQSVSYFAVNLFDPAESDIRPRETIAIGRSTVGAAVKAEAGQREFWPWLAGAALLLLVLEWWVYHRGAALPSRPRPPVRPAPSGRGWLWKRKEEQEDSVSGLPSARRNSG